MEYNPVEITGREQQRGRDAVLVPLKELYSKRRSDDGNSPDN